MDNKAKRLATSARKMGIHMQNGTDAPEPQNNSRTDRRTMWIIGVGGGVISSAAFVLLFQPAIEGIRAAALGAGGQAASFIVDRAYANGVSNAEPLAIYGIYSIAVMFTMFLICGFAFSVFIFADKTKDIWRKLDDLENPERISNQEYSPERLKTSLRNIDRSYLYLKIISTSLAVAFSASLVISLTMSSIALDANVSFNQRMLALAPIASLDEANRLRGDWARVKNRKDYERLMKAMDALAKEHGTTLPTPRI